MILGTLMRLRAPKWDIRSKVDCAAGMMVGGGHKVVRPTERERQGASNPKPWYNGRVDIFRGRSS